MSIALCIINKFLFYQSLKKETAGINVQTAVWPDPPLSMVTGLPIQNHTGTKDITKEDQGHVCHMYHAAILDVYQQTSCNKLKQHLQHKGTFAQKPGNSAETVE